MKITVTQEDINEGARRECRGCPVALAVQRTLSEGQYCQVSYCYIHFYSAPKGERLARYEIPEEVRKWIWDFDHENSVSPIEFETEIA